MSAACVAYARPGVTTCLRYKTECQYRACFQGGDEAGWCGGAMYSRHPVLLASGPGFASSAAGRQCSKGIGCLPVVDGMKLVGIVTKTDLLRCLRTLSAA